MTNPIKQIPHSLDLEKAILGAMINHAEALSIGIVELEKDDFYKSDHQRVFQTLIEASKKPDHPRDVVAYADDLDRATSGQESGNGWGFTLSEMLDYATTAKIRGHCQKLRDYRTRRDAILFAAKIQASAYDTGNEILNTIESSFYALTKSKVGANESGYENISGSMESILDGLLVPAEDRPRNFIKSPWEKLNAGIIGFFPGEVTVVAARPSMGKTAFALDIALHSAEIGKKVAICSMEMNKVQLANRFYSMQTRISPVRIKSKNLTPNEISQISKVRDHMKNLNLFVDDSRRMSPLKIRSKLMQLKEPAEILIVDYLDKFYKDRGENDYEKLSRCIVELEDIAIELNIPVICLQQISRFVEKSSPQAGAGKKARKIPPYPRMSDLLGSGVIENTAYVVMAIHRNEYYDPSVDPGIAEILLLKNRDGQRMSKAKLGFDGPATRFTNELPQQQEDFGSTHWSDN